MSRNQIYNVSEEQQEIMRWRDAKRRQLREIYLRDAGHPTRSLLCDTGIYRLASANATVAKRFMPTLTNFLTKSLFIGALLTSTYFAIETRRAKREHMYRTGQVSYADREYKLL